MTRPRTVLALLTALAAGWPAPSLALAPAATSPPAAAATPPASQTLDPELAAIDAELRRGLAGLRVNGTPAPYRAEVRMVRAELLSLDGSYGGVVVNLQDRQSAGAAEIRVGTAARDNTNFFGGDSGIAPIEVALEATPKYAAKKVWLALDNAFRGASKAWSQKQVVLKRLAGAEQPADFSPGSAPTVRLLPLPEAQIDRDGLSAMVGSLSARFGEHPKIDNGDVHVQVLRTQETVLNSEGVALQWVRERAVLAVVADTKAADGMHLDHGYAIHFQSVPAADDALLAAGEALVDKTLLELEQLAAAPMIEEDYDGPLLFVGEASAQLLGATVATEAVGTPAPLGETGRMVDLEPSWQPKLGKQVMPAQFDLIDDPTLAGGFGSFDIDAEGVRPGRLTLVRDGKLETLLMTRVPNAKLAGSNGRARMSAALESGATISNLTLSSRRKGLSRAALERELLARAAEDGYEFAYVIESLRDGTVLGPVPRESAAAYAGTGNLNLPLPARLFRIDASGQRTLIRGAVLAPASMRVLRRIRAIGSQPHTLPMRIPVGAYGGFGADVGVDGALSQTVDAQVTTPDLLVDGLELLVERGEHEKPPTLEHPLRRKDKPLRRP
ncbi:MAG: metallopeptidase TldD-related protein [Nannocystaceae bacterium]